GKVAVVTGGGAGLGRAMALTFAGKGMDIAIADVDDKAAAATAAEIRAKGVKCLTANVDVTDRTAMGACAERVFSELGGCHVLCNTAGVSTFVPAHELSDADWDWVVGVDLIGVIYGVQAFLPRMLKQGQGGHIVNTASIAGQVPLNGIVPYHTAKYAVVGLTESLAMDLAADNIGSSCLCPGLVKTGIGDSQRNRPDRFGGPGPTDTRVQAGIEATGYDPMDVAAMVLKAVEEDQVYILTHPEFRPMVEARRDRILAAYDWAATGA
ncbi:MAG: SDR family NAD(P)-dependent oxidoreductase, partial [Dehalococcoidia bacterium]